MRTTENVTKETAQQAKDAWKSDGTAGDIKVVGKALEYVPLDMKPADLQFLETQKFDTTQIARLLGIPASIMLAAVDGSNLTYSNIEQSWIEFADYTLSAYTGEIEEIFNRLLPRGLIRQVRLGQLPACEHERPLHGLQDSHRGRFPHRR